MIKKCVVCGNKMLDRTKNKNKKYCSKKCLYKFVESKPERKKYIQEYFRSPKGKSVIKSYRKSPKGKIVSLRAKKKYLSTEQGKQKQREYDNLPKRKEYFKRWQQSPKGKLKNIIQKAKRRRLGYKKILNNPFNKKIEVEWHHIDDEHLIPVPKEIHNKCNHPNRLIHRKKVLTEIKKIPELKAINAGWGAWE